MDLLDDVLMLSRCGKVQFNDRIRDENQVSMDFTTAVSDVFDSKLPSPCPGMVAALFVCEAEKQKSVTFVGNAFHF